MKKGEFNLKDFAIDCSELPNMGKAGKEIFRALKVACNGVDDDRYGAFDSICKINRYLILDPIDSIKLFTDGLIVSDIHLDEIQPSDVLSQYAIDAAMDGATIVFEGDELPSGILSICDNTGRTYTRTVYEKTNLGQGSIAVAYKFLESVSLSPINGKILAEKLGSKHSHYFKDVSDLDELDVYRVCELFEVNDTSGAKQHAIKKLLCSGKRGAKDERKDLEEARDTINRKLAMMAEDGE